MDKGSDAPVGDGGGRDGDGAGASGARGERAEDGHRSPATGGPVADGGHDTGDQRAGDDGDGRFEAILDGMADSVFTVRPDGSVGYANRRLLAVTGLAREELVGRHYEDLRSFSGEDYDAYESGIKDVLDGEATERRVDALAKSPVEGEVPVELRITRLPDDRGALVVMRDVSERAAYETELEETTDQLAVLNRLLRHDIRNDAAVMAGWSEHLLEELDDEDHRADVERIHAAAHHVVELTREARDVEAILTDTGEMDLGSVPLGPTIERELDGVRTSFPSASFTIAGELPDVDVRANELLGTVFRNLLANAAQHSDTEEPTVEVTTEREGDTVAVTVADDGPGVPPDRRDGLFERGAKGLDSTGSGMGLYLVAALLELYDGAVDVDDAALGGAAFTVRLPVAGA